jgi:arsenate reductase
MAAALLERAGAGKVRVRSAGSAPADDIHPEVKQVMSEVGIDLDEKPKGLSDEAVRAADVVITMGCGDACPVYPGKRYEDWDLPDPAGKSIEQVRAIRDEIAGRVDRLVSDLTKVQ